MNLTRKVNFGEATAGNMAVTARIFGGRTTQEVQQLHGSTVKGAEVEACQEVWWNQSTAGQAEQQSVCVAPAVSSYQSGDGHLN